MMSPLLNQTCHIARYTGEYTIVGEDCHSDPEQYVCRIDYENRLVYNQSGVEVPSIATVYLETDVTEHDWVYLDAEYIEVTNYNLTPFDLLAYNTGDAFEPETVSRFVPGTARKPITVKHLYDRSGNFHHCEVAV